MQPIETLTLQAVQEAQQRIAPYARRTPLLDNDALSQLLGCQVYLKPEMLQRTGSFKLRGALNKSLQLGREELDRGLLGQLPGRTSDQEITIFDTTGTAMQDNTTAFSIYHRALEKGLGRYFDFFSLG